MFCGVQEILQGEFSRDWPEHKLVCGFETDEFDKLAFGALPTQLRAPRRLPFKLDLAAHERQLKVGKSLNKYSMSVLTCVLDLRRRYLLWTGVASRLAIVQWDILYAPYFDGYRFPSPLCYYSLCTMSDPKRQLMDVPVATDSE